MYATERQQRIAGIVTDEGRASVTALSALFGVAQETIRRDLDQLQADGVLLRVHGGAVPAGRTSAAEPSLAAREATATAFGISPGPRSPMPPGQRTDPVSALTTTAVGCSPGPRSSAPPGHRTDPVMTRVSTGPTNSNSSSDSTNGSSNRVSVLFWFCLRGIIHTSRP